MMRKAFTLIELVVSLGILAVILSFAGVIFRVSIESQRMAMANAEVMQKLRIITEQLDSDFRGGAIPTRFPYGYPVHFSYNMRSPVGGGTATPMDSDAVLLVTAGDFRSTEQYGGQTIAGNVACVFYGQPDPNSYARPPRPYEKVLLRRQTILTVDGAAFTFDPFAEYARLSPQGWLVNQSIDPNAWIRRPVIDPNNVKANLPMFVAQGVDSFTVHYLDASTQLQTGVIPWIRPTGASAINAVINPKAFKFTFTLYDSKGILKQGRTFTHIVVWDS
jgi:prepilin-type N-terminal cleavage/methylation domain-containing protein